MRPGRIGHRSASSAPLLLCSSTPPLLSPSPPSRVHDPNQSLSSQPSTTVHTRLECGECFPLLAQLPFLLLSGRPGARSLTAEPTPRTPHQSETHCVTRRPA